MSVPAPPTMNSGVPTMLKERSPGAAFLLIPRSVMMMCPLLVRRMFSIFRSR